MNHWGLQLFFQCKDSPFPWSIYADPQKNIPLTEAFPALVFQLQNASFVTAENEAEHGATEHKKASTGIGTVTVLFSNPYVLPLLLNWCDEHDEISMKQTDPT